MSPLERILLQSRNERVERVTTEEFYADDGEPAEPRRIADTRAVVRLVSEGLSQREVARRLGISQQHVSRIWRRA